jgi:hypothetical protein
MRVDALLRRLVVVGREQERAVGAGVLRVARQLDRLAGRVRAGAGQDRDATLRGLDDDLDDAAVLEMGEGRGLTGGSEGAESPEAAGKKRKRPAAEATGLL